MKVLNSKFLAGLLTVLLILTSIGSTSSIVLAKDQEPVAGPVTGGKTEDKDAVNPEFAVETPATERLTIPLMGPESTASESASLDGKTVQPSTSSGIKGPAGSAVTDRQLDAQKGKLTSSSTDKPSSPTEVSVRPVTLKDLGLEISFKAEEGALPEGAVLQVEKAEKTKSQKVKASQVDTDEQVISLDISFLLTGQKTQPKAGKKVTLQVQGDIFKTMELVSLVHEGEGQDQGESLTFEQNRDTGMVTFVASSFSPFHFVLRQKPSAAIHLDGAAGNDDNDGLTKETAVKTFAQAKALVEGNSTIKTIYVHGTVTIAGDVSLADRADVVVRRGENFAGDLFKVNPNTEASLSNITMDGGSKKVGNPLIRVDSGTLNIKEGAVLQNNYGRFGGVISATQAKIKMTGGVIQGNQATQGGGIYISQSTMTFSNGKVQNNQTFSEGRDYGFGGGIAIDNGSTINLTGEAQIINNEAEGSGAGLSIGADKASSGINTLQMTGGIISGNESSYSGGGIFIQAGTSDNNYSVGHISAGQITNNKAYNLKAEFTGGGIYVNGMPDEWTEGGKTYYPHNGELYLTNVLIEGNDSSRIGDGLAACPVAKTKIYLQDGGIIAGNGIPEYGVTDIHISSEQRFGVHSGKASEYKIASRMLGGAPYKWINSAGVPYKDEELEGTAPWDDWINFEATGEVSPEAKKLAKVLITGNWAYGRGGGIGSNGTVIIGTDAPKKDLQVVKTWSEGLTPEEIEIELRGKVADLDWLVEKVKLNAGNGFSHVFQDLPAKILGQNHETTYYIKELAQDKYQAEVSPIGPAQMDDKLSFTLEWPIRYLKQSGQDDYPEIYAAYWNRRSIDPDCWNWGDWRPKDFTATYSVLDSTGNTLGQGEMNFKYTYQGYEQSWQGKINFSGLPIDTKNLTVEYYGSEEDNYIESWLLDYKLYLERRGDQTVLKVPDLKPMLRFPGPDPEKRQAPVNPDQEPVLQVKDIKIAPEGNQRFEIKVKNSKLVDIAVTKVWQDGNNQDGKRPDAVTVKLLADGVDTGKTLVLSAANQWKGAFEDLKAYKNGQKIVYTIEEVNVGNGYSRVVTGDAATGYTITNSRTPEPTPTTTPTCPTTTPTCPPTQPQSYPTTAPKGCPTTTPGHQHKPVPRTGETGSSIALAMPFLGLGLAATLAFVKKRRTD